MFDINLLLPVIVVAVLLAFFAGMVLISRN
jgi:hypothetical protein